MRRAILLIIIMLFTASLVFAVAEPIGEVTDYAFSTMTATTSGVGTNSINQDIWYVFTAPGDGWIDVDLCGSGFDTKLEIYDDCIPTTSLAYNDNGCYTRALQSSLEDVAVLNGEDYYIQVGGYSSNAGFGDITLVFTPIPTTPLFVVTPTTFDFGTVNITETSADLSWTPGATEELWDVEWGYAGYGGGGSGVLGTQTGLTSPAYALTGLSSGTSYDWYVRSDYGSRFVSAWVGPESFTTEINWFCATYTICLTDDNGDGWNGGVVDVFVNGILRYDDLTLASGAGPECFYFEVGVFELITTVYTAGEWPEENEYYILNQFMVEVGSDGVGGTVPVGISDPIITCPQQPDLAISPYSLIFGGVIDGNCSGTQAFSISNIGGGTLDVTGTALGGTHASAYVMVDPNSYPISLASGQSLPLPITVDFCPPSPDSYFDVYLEVTSVYEVRTAVLSGVGITGNDPLCSSTETIFSQVADITNWNSRTSELVPGYGLDYKAFDNYSVLTDITNIHFWGLQLIYNASFGPGSTENPTQFLIEFWNDDGASFPDNSGAPVYSELVTLTGTPLVDVGGYFLWEWNYTFATPVTLQDGWVSIQGQTSSVIPDEDNWFMWMSSKMNTDGDLRSVQWTGTAWTDPPAVYDFGLCLTSVPQPDPPANVLIEVFPGTDEVVVSWDYVGGLVYTVYSDVDPYEAFATVEGSGIAAESLTISPIPVNDNFYKVTADYAPPADTGTNKKASSEVNENVSAPVKRDKKVFDSNTKIDKRTLGLTIE